MTKYEKIILWIAMIIFSVSLLLIFKGLLNVFDELNEILMKPSDTLEVTKTVYVEVPVVSNVEEVELLELEEEPNYLIEVTDDEIDLLARVIMSEASICDIDIKYCIAQTVVNRVLSDEFPNTLEEVVNQSNQYSTQDNGKPTEECYKAAEWALTYQFLPSNTYYFRTDHYHNFGTPLLKMGNVYFSTN